jgi:hypothetical protein
VLSPVPEGGARDVYGEDCPEERGRGDSARMAMNSHQHRDEPYRFYIDSWETILGGA